jgi:chromosome segregation ATPase
MMQPIENSADELIQKIELLSREFKRLSGQIEELKKKNENLNEEVVKYKAEIQRMQDKTPGKYVHTDESDAMEQTEAIQEELEKYIAELDECIENMKQL